jgi:hypothetical protein
MNDVVVLQEVIRKLHGCESEHVGSIPITEHFRDKVVWEGVVEVFSLRDHPKAKRCYAWFHHQDDQTMRYVAVLELPPVTSARKAVQVAIAAEAKGQG